MREHLQYSTLVKPRRLSLDDLIGRTILLMLVALGIGLTVLWPRIAVPPSQVTAAVAPVDPGQIAVLVQHHQALRAQLGVSVAPVSPADIATLVHQHAALREQLALTVAPVDSGQIATLIRQHTAKTVR